MYQPFRFSAFCLVELFSLCTITSFMAELPQQVMHKEVIVKVTKYMKCVLILVQCRNYTSQKLFIEVKFGTLVLLSDGK